MPVKRSECSLSDTVLYNKIVKQLYLYVILNLSDLMKIQVEKASTLLDLIPFELQFSIEDEFFKVG